jgi:hypothetical protein
MELKGDLGILGILDLIQTLSNMGKTGKLEIVLPTREKGEIFFKNGKLIHAHSIDNIGKEALIEILNWKSGSFRFVENIILPSPTIDEETSKSVLDAMVLQDEFKNKEDILNFVPIINDKVEVENFSLNIDEWRFLNLVDGKKRCCDIIEYMGTEKVKMIKIVEELYKKGIISFRKEKENG